MEEMLEKILSIEKSYNELGEKLSDPAVIQDCKLLTQNAAHPGGVFLRLRCLQKDGNRCTIELYQFRRKNYEAAVSE